MTIATNIIEAVTRSDVVAVTLYGGYCVHSNGTRSLFDPARIAAERRNADGRCTFLDARYEDGSRIEFRWHPARGARYAAKAKGGRT